MQALKSQCKCPLSATLCRERTDSLERSKASMGVKLAAAQEEAAHVKSELGSEAGQASKLKAQLQAISEAHSKVWLALTASSSAGRY